MVETVDELVVQRQGVFTAATRVVEALRFGESSDGLAHMLTALRDDAGALFAVEERAMHAMGYPGTDAHQHDHVLLSNALTRLWKAAKALSQQSSAKRDKLAQRFLREFSSRMVRHTQTFDRELSGFMNGADCAVSLADVH